MGNCDWCDKTATTICYNCKTTLCDDHVKKCKNCNDHTCSGCGKICPECNEWRCDDDNKYDTSRSCTMTRCGGCDRIVCNGCGWSDENSSTGFTCVGC